MAGGITLLSATAANAAETDGDDGVISGTQAVTPVEIPVDITGNAIVLLGISSADAAPPGPAETPPPAALRWWRPPIFR